MAVVHFVRKVPAADGSLVPATGSFRFTPTARRVVFGTPDVVVMPLGFSVPLIDGALDVTLAPTTGAWVWRVDENVHGVSGRTSHVAVPDVAEVDDTDLVAVDPATLEPAATPEPAWVAMAQSTITSGTVTGDDLILTRTDATTVNAGNVRGSAGPAGADSTVPGPTGPQGPQGPAGSNATATTDASQLTSGTLDDARLPSTSNAATVGGKVSKASNLSDLPSAATARINLGLGDSSTHAASDFATPTQAAGLSAALSIVFGG